MECGTCGISLERPGDRCLACGERNTDAVIVDIEAERAQLTMIADRDIRGRTTITTTAETADPLREQQERNFVGRIVDEIRRKRPEDVYVNGERETIRRLRRTLAHDLYRIDGDDPVEAYLEARDRDPLAIVEGSTQSKLGGGHTTLIGGRAGRRVIDLVADHPHIKRIVPGPIDASGHGSQVGFDAKITRADDRGNLRLLIRDGASVQTVRLITTGRRTPDGERIGAQLTEALDAA